MQHDYTIANQGFPATRADINNALSAIATNNSGTSAPSTQYAGQFWIDTTSSTWTLYIHDGADDIQFATIDTSANTVNFIDSELGDNSVTTAKIADGNVTSAKLSYPLTTFSSTGIDDNATSTAITIDSSENVGIGTASPSTKLTINEGGEPPAEGMLLLQANSSSRQLRIQPPTNADNGFIDFRGGNLAFLDDGTEVVRFQGGGNVGIGTSSPDAKLSVNGVASFGDGTAAAPSVANFGDLNTGMWFPAADTIAFSEGGVEAMRIDSSGNVGIKGTPKAYLQPNYKAIDMNSGRTVLMASTLTPQTNLLTNAYYVSGGFLYSNTGYGATNYVGQDSEHKWYTAPSGTADASLTFTEVMRIDSSGNVLIGKTGLNNLEGIRLSGDGEGYFVRDSFTPLAINRLTNDGALVAFYQDTSNEGSISVSGATVSYNGFTGTHWSRFTDNSKPNILRGTVLESLDEMCDWYNLHFETTTTTQDNDGNDVTNTENHVVPHVLQNGQSDGDVITYDWNTEKKDENDNDIIEQVQATIIKETDIKHVKSKVSDTVDAKNVYGVFVAYDEDGEGYNDFYVASVGSFVVRIKANETIAKGDLLQSNGDGTAKVQTDDAIRSSSFAKVLSTTVIETYDDGSYLVPCSLMC